MGNKGNKRDEGVNERPAALGIFVGTFFHALDPKRRLTIPSEWREQSGESESFYVLPGVDQPCLVVFPARVIAGRLERIRHHSIADAQARQFARVLGSRSQLVPWDSQGRIRVKDELLALAGIETQVALIGAFEGFELWHPGRWRESGSMDGGSLGEAARYVGF